MKRLLLDKIVHKNLKQNSIRLFSLYLSYMKTKQIKNFSILELQKYLVEKGEQKFRAGQIFNWIFVHRIEDFDEMENLPKRLREKLSNDFDIQTLEKIQTQDSASTATKKFLLKTHDGHNIESVVIPDGDRNTLCLSTQVGCPLDCKFCATGLMGYKRNLTAAEIVDQFLMTEKEYGKGKITNIVYMGMGEPLLNFDNTMKSLSLLIDDKAIGLSKNRITVSTSGIPHRIKEIADSKLGIGLALSLHSPFDDVRSKIMPINIKYPLKEVIESLKYYTSETKSRITFEYTMLKDLNDRDEDVKELARIFSQLHIKINIIPFNSIAHMNPGGISATLEPTPKERIYEFAEKLRAKHITVMIRETQGDDIAAACGQLAAKN